MFDEGTRFEGNRYREIWERSLMPLVVDDDADGGGRGKDVVDGYSEDAELGG